MNAPSYLSQAQGETEIEITEDKTSSLSKRDVKVQAIFGNLK